LQTAHKQHQVNDMVHICALDALSSLQVKPCPVLHSADLASPPLLLLLLLLLLLPLVMWNLQVCP
jgi:hypothetical protein